MIDRFVEWAGNEGWEPEFEYPTEVADNLNEFLEKILSGEIKLVI